MSYEKIVFDFLVLGDIVMDGPVQAKSTILSWQSK